MKSAAYASSETPTNPVCRRRLISYFIITDSFGLGLLANNNQFGFGNGTFASLKLSHVRIPNRRFTFDDSYVQKIPPTYRKITDYLPIVHACRNPCVLRHSSVVFFVWFHSQSIGKNSAKTSLLPDSFNAAVISGPLTLEPWSFYLFDRGSTCQMGRYHSAKDKCWFSHRL
jgi:hypothetical protein